MSSDTQERNMIWVIPLIAIVLMLAYAIFVRSIVGPTDDQVIDKWGTEFVPAASPQSTGADSR